MNKITTHSLREGDILDALWGYDQSNVNFYLVTELVGKTIIKIIQIEAIKYEDINGGSMVIPNIKKTIGKTIRKKANKNNYVRPNDYLYASQWDGKPCFIS